MTHTQPTLDDADVTPYAATSGWSGSDTSRDRAIAEDAAGVTRTVMERALTLAADRGTTGITWPEVDAHHGRASGALSRLHKAGRLARLATTKRGRCAVYVLPEHVDGRAVAEHGRRGARTGLSDAEVKAVTALRRAASGGGIATVYPADVSAVLAALERAMS